MRKVAGRLPRCVRWIPIPAFGILPAGVRAASNQGLLPIDARAETCRRRALVAILVGASASILLSAVPSFAAGLWLVDRGASSWPPWSQSSAGAPTHDRIAGVPHALLRGKQLSYCFRRSKRCESFVIEERSYIPGQTHLDAEVLERPTVL